MHHTAIQNGKMFFDTYVSPMERPTVLDIGSQDINGTLRQVCPHRATYVGVDFSPGKNVDVVLDDPYKLTFEDESIDIVVSSSCFEHSEMFWILYLEIMRVLRPSGLFYLNAPSNGPYHRFPVDCWRFYPDCGSALLCWGRRNGLNGAILESYVSNPYMLNQYLEPWQDFVCVFIKDESRVNRHPRRILNSFGDFTNGLAPSENGGMQLRNPTWPIEGLESIAANATEDKVCH